jgi:hypothetical protein
MTCELFWRRRLRDEIATRLSGVTDAGSRIFKQRALPWNIFQPDDQAAYPALAIYADEGRFDDGSAGTFTASAEVTVEAFVTGGTEEQICNALESLQFQIYHALLERELSRCTIVSFSDDEPYITTRNVAIGAARMTFACVFELCMHPSGELDAFEEAGIDIDQQIPDGVIDIALTANPEQPPEPDPDPEPEPEP